jgi:hypothetical protein
VNFYSKFIASFYKKIEDKGFSDIFIYLPRYNNQGKVELASFESDRDILKKVKKVLIEFITIYAMET